MNIALIGSGGREHAICEKIFLSKKADKIYCIPGNAGTSKIAQNVDLKIESFSKLYKFFKLRKISLVIVGPEEPLVKGLTDYLQKKKIKVFGPSKYASKLEGSKAFMKRLCKKNNIPTADYKICRNINDVKKFIEKNSLPIVVKADGLAAGKGVTICKNKTQIYKISDEIFKGKFKSSNKLILEKFLEGEEASYFLIVDRKNYKFFGTAQDHKRVGEKDKGPNTGGMGAYSPAPIVNKILERKIIKKIVRPTLLALKRKGSPYTGFLYVGLMIKNNEPYLIEFNVRMGDPECQVILPRLKSDLLEVINYAVKNELHKIKIKWKKERSMTIVLCSKGYPSKYINNKPIKNLSKINLKKNFFIFHAGTKINKDNIVSNGGRVLNITGIGKKISKLRSDIIKIIKKINWKNGFYRKDIGWRIIEK
jgi:phosphoribosylamine--glycine ligase